MELEDSYVEIHRPLLDEKQPNFKKYFVGVVALLGCLAVALAISLSLTGGDSSSGGQAQEETQSVRGFGTVSLAPSHPDRKQIQATYDVSAEMQSRGYAPLWFEIVDDADLALHSFELRDLEGHVIYAIKSENDQVSWSAMGVSSSDSKTAQDAALVAFFSTGEAKTLPLLSYDLGTHFGLSARENPSTMAVHGLAMMVEEHFHSLHQERQTRSDICWISPAQGECEGEGAYFEEGCGDECTGMCGPTCDCWDHVCGDCCWHPGCYLNDTIACADGYMSWDCISGRFILWDVEGQVC
eukprot:TRINITY_DN2531_c0_g2::TRINITY_DN2531_c0_g2_i2::g.19361::m.19361 TRINITY_DN2531_c0_g2::TRINITY_DN2531_c0_g2_i2::g.19361  ORF type:complete len:297 (+),score=37.60 TRINITY_DN2531_c0_g2_i2:58-948(+)